MSTHFDGGALVPYSGTIGAHRVGAQEYGTYGKPNHVGKTGVTDDEIIALRRERVRVNDIAARLGVSTNTVCYVLKRHGMVGKEWRTPSNRKACEGSKRDPMVALMEALHEYGGLYMELADLPNGKDGVLVTIANEFPGMACSSIPAALRSAIAALGDRECTRGGRA